MGEKGTAVRFLGIIKPTEFTPRSLFQGLIEGKVYEILDNMEYESDHYYLICKNYREDSLWYPVENFESVFSRELIVKKYNLK